MEEKNFFFFAILNIKTILMNHFEWNGNKNQNDYGNRDNKKQQTNRELFQSNFTILLCEKKNTN